MPSACGPLRRMMPMPPRPCGVDNATIVSSGGCIWVEPSGRGDDDPLEESVPFTVRRDTRLVGQREMDDTPLVRVERFHLDRLARPAHLLGYFGSPLGQIVVPAAAIPLAVEDDPLGHTRSVLGHLDEQELQRLHDT